MQNFDSQFGGIQFNRYNAPQPQPKQQNSQPMTQSQVQPQQFNRPQQPINSQPQPMTQQPRPQVQPQPQAQPQMRTQPYPQANQAYSQPMVQPQAQQQPKYQNPYNQNEPKKNDIVLAKDEPNKDYSLELPSGKICLSPSICNQFVSGNSKITQMEYNMFYSLCQITGANPFLKECHLVKYGNQPAQCIIDYKFLEKTMEKESNYDGMEQGVVVIDSNGNNIEREGALIFPNEKLIAGWCRIFRKDKSHPTKVYAMFEEFYTTTKEGAITSNWSKKPAFMIVKVAEAQCIRKAFPNSVSNTYTKEEEEIIQNDILSNERSEMDCQAMDNVIDAKVNTMPLDNDL